MSASGARRAGRFGAAALVGGLLALGALPAAEAAQASAPLAAAKAKSSWKTVRTVEFSGSKIPDGCEAYSGTYSGGESAWSTKNTDVAKGLLTLTLEKRKISGQPYASGGIGCWGWAQKYGRYEVKAKVPAGKGIDSYITLTPSKGDDGAWTGLELLAPGPDTAYVTNGYGTKSESARVTGDFAGEYHTYVIEWAPKYLRMTVDGKDIFFSDRAYTKARWLGLVMSNGDELTGVPDATTKLPAKFQIDRVKVSSYTGVPPKAPASAQTPRVSGAPTAVPTTAAPTTEAKAPSATPTQVSAAPSTDDQGPALAGGIWPWLLGGSLIAAGAAATLNHPRLRRPGR